MEGVGLGHAATERNELRDRVLAWMAQTGGGYKAASRQFGVPRSTVQRWRRAWAPQDGGTDNVVAEIGPPDGPPEAAEPADAEASDWITFLRAKISDVARQVAQAEGRGHTSSIARLQELHMRLREKLELAIRAREDADGTARDIPDPAAVAGEALDLVPLLACLAPEQCRKLIAELEAALG